MDVGVKIKCGTCLSESYMYQDTHGKAHNRVSGMCPTCNRYLTAKITGKELELYPDGSFYERGQVYNPVAYYEHT